MKTRKRLTTRENADTFDHIEIKIFCPQNIIKNIKRINHTLVGDTDSMSLIED